MASLPSFLAAGSRRRLRGIRLAFRGWRRSRPFWAGVWAILGGAVIAYVPGTAFKFSLVPGSLIWLGVLVGILIMIFGLFLWIQPALRYLLGALIVVFSLASFMSSDFGGLLVGMLFGLIGGALAIAWTPYPSGAGESRPLFRTRSVVSGAGAARSTPPVDDSVGSTIVEEPSAEA